MAFLEFEKYSIAGRSLMRPTGNSFQLAGYQLIHEAWKRRNCPINQGWHVSAEELIQLNTQGKENCSTRALIIDFDPCSKSRIGRIELLEIYAYTWGDNSGNAGWTPLMLRMRDLYYEEYDQQMDVIQKQEVMSEIEAPGEQADFVEFLYLNGPNNGWNWGMSGRTNAVFLQGAARDYFREFF